MKAMIYQEDGASIVIFDIEKGYFVKSESLVGNTIKLVHIDDKTGSLILELD